MSLIDGIISEERRYASMPYTETGSNHQVFSDIVNAYGLAGCQDQAWCATYQFALELQTCGKEQALRNWCMTDGYVGYSVFATRDKFKTAGRTGSVPKVGALVIFKRSHMGRVLSVNTSTFVCGEGNTSNKEFSREGDACAVKTYSKTDPGIDCFCYIDYEDAMTPNQLIEATKAVYEMAHNLRWHYGDSHSLPPCIGDSTISCDRMIFLALWNLGYQNQPKGGATVINMEAYLLNWGFQKITDINALKAGDIVLFRNASPIPNAGWHTFLLTAYNGPNDIWKYDMGSQERINSKQPFHTTLNEWGGGRAFYAAFRIGSKDAYIFNPVTIRAGASGKSQFATTRILKARGYKGVIKDGVQQDLELNDSFTKGDIAALVKYKYDRMINGKDLCKGILADEVNRKVYEDLFGMTIPIECVTVPDKCRTGPLVLWLQEVLRSEGFTGADGQPIGLDQEFGPNTEHAVKEYQKTYGFEPTGKVTADVWKHMCTNRKTKPH